MRFYCTLLIFTFIGKLHVDAYCSNPKLNNGFDCGDVPESENACKSKKYRGHVMYYLSAGQCRTYDDAQAYCKQHHMEMASFHDRNLYLWIRAKACTYAGKEITWLGPRKSGNTWKNPDGTTVPSDVMRTDEMGGPDSVGFDCVVLGITYTPNWFPTFCTEKAKFMCQTAIPGCKIHSIPFHVYSQGKRKRILQNTILFAGEYFECEHSGNSVFFEKWTFSQVCGGKALTSIDCRLGECRIKLKPSDENCQLNCIPKVWSRFRNYVNKSLFVTPALIKVRIENGGETHCMSYYNKAHYFHQLNLTFDRVEIFCKLFKRSVVDIQGDGNYLAWVARAGRKFSSGSKWYFSPASCNTGECCYSSYMNGHDILQTTPCTTKAYFICSDKTEDCNSEQINDQEKDPKKVYPIDGKGYVFLRVSADFYEAVKICETRDMTLPKIYSTEQMKAIYEFSDKVQLNKKWWINVKKSFDGKFYNYDGSTVAHEIWHKDSKKNKQSNRCTVFGQELMYKWNTYECYDKANVMCQHPSPTGISPPKPEPFWTSNRITTAILLGCIGFVILCVIILLTYIGITYTAVKRRKILLKDMSFSYS